MPQRYIGTSEPAHQHWPRRDPRVLRQHFYDAVYLLYLAMLGTEINSEITIFRENHKKL